MNIGTPISNAHEIVRQAFDSMFVFVACHAPDGTLHDTNRAALDAAGVTRADVVGKHVTDLVWWAHLPQTRQRVRDAFSRAVRGERVRLDVEAEAMPGKRCIVDTVFSPIRDENGSVIAVFASAVDVTERRLAEEAIATARQEEAERIARDLHDHLGSELTALNWEIQNLRSAAAAGKAVDVTAELEHLAAMVQMNIDTVRRLAFELRPAIPDSTALRVTIESVARQFQSRSDVLSRVSGELPDVPLAEEQADAIYRIVQEALTNVHRHADAKHVEIAFSVENQDFVITVADDGQGFREEDASKSLGMIGMRERARIAGGALEIRSAPAAGTKVVLRIPLDVIAART